MAEQGMAKQEFNPILLNPYKLFCYTINNAIITLGEKKNKKSYLNFGWQILGI